MQIDSLGLVDGEVIIDTDTGETSLPFHKIIQFMYLHPNDRTNASLFNTILNERDPNCTTPSQYNCSLSVAFRVI